MSSASKARSQGLQKVGWAVASGGIAVLSDSEATELGAFEEAALSFEDAVQTVVSRMAQAEGVDDDAL